MYQDYQSKLQIFKSAAFGRGLSRFDPRAPLRSVQASGICLPSTPEILSVPRHQYEVLFNGVFHQLPILETQPSTVSNGSGLDMPSVDRELRELRRQALIDE